MRLGIVLPILLVASLPILLWALARRPFRMTSPGLRFKCSCLLILLTWCGAKVVYFHVISAWNWMAGLLFILSFLIFGFMVWSVLCWGYTLCMLLSLEEHRSAPTSEEWQKLHAGPNGIRQLTLDRVQVLINFGLVMVKNDRITMTKKGECLSIFAKLLMKIFGTR